MSMLPRRTLVRTGVTTAWTAPILVVAVPASAAACSGGLVQLTAQEVPGSRVESFDTFGWLSVAVTLDLANSGEAGSLVSASVTSNGGLLRLFAIGRAVLGDIGTIIGDASGQSLTMTVLPSAPLAAQASQELRIEYQLWASAMTIHTIDLSFQPDCGTAAVYSITTDLNAVPP